MLHLAFYDMICNPLINSSFCKKVDDFKQLCLKQPCLICFLPSLQMTIPTASNQKYKKVFK